MNDEGELTDEKGKTLHLDPKQLFLDFHHSELSLKLNFYSKISTQGREHSSVILLLTVTLFLLKSATLLLYSDSN